MGVAVRKFHYRCTIFGLWNCVSQLACNVTWGFGTQSMVVTLTSWSSWCPVAVYTPAGLWCVAVCVMAHKPQKMRKEFVRRVKRAASRVAEEISIFLHAVSACGVRIKQRSTYVSRVITTWSFVYCVALRKVV